MTTLISIEQANQDPAVELLLPETTALSVAQNFPTMLNNFVKITGWIIQGADSPNPLPPVLKGVADQLDNNSSAIADLREYYKALAKDMTDAFAAHGKAVAQMQLDEGQAIADLRKEMAKEMAALREELAGAVTPKKTRAKKEPEVVAEVAPQPVIEAPVAVEPDQVDLTAEAVGAGTLDTESLTELDNLLAAL